MNIGDVNEIWWFGWPLCIEFRKVLVLYEYSARQM